MHHRMNDFVNDYALEEFVLGDSGIRSAPDQRRDALIVCDTYSLLLGVKKAEDWTTESMSKRPSYLNVQKLSRKESTAAEQLKRIPDGRTR